MLTSHLLPGTTLTVSRLALGTAHLGLKQTEPEAHALLDHFVALGGNFLDTARIYSDWVPGETGRTERILGDWLRARPAVRDKIVVATKGGHYVWSRPGDNRVTASAVRADLEASLRTLGLETIPLYWLHRDNPARPVEEIVDFMQVFVREGKVRHLGVANWSGDRLIAANAYAARHRLAGFAAHQPHFNLGCWDLAPAPDPTLTDLDRAAYEYHRRTQLPLLPYSPQAQGFFTHATAGAAPGKLAGSRYATPTNFRLGPLVAALARAHGCTVNRIVLAYLLHQPLPVFPIIGANRRAQLDDSVASLGVRLTRAELQQLEDAAGSGIRH